MVGVLSNDFTSISKKSKIINIAKMALESFLITDICMLNNLFDESINGSILPGIFEKSTIRTCKELVELSSIMDKAILFKNFKFKDISNTGNVVYLTIEWEVLTESFVWIPTECFVHIKLNNIVKVEIMNLFMSHSHLIKKKSHFNWFSSLPRLFNFKRKKNMLSYNEQQLKETELS